MRIAGGRAAPSGGIVFLAAVACLVIAAVAEPIEEFTVGPGMVGEFASVMMGSGLGARAHLLGGYSVYLSQVLDGHLIYHVYNNSWTDGVKLPEPRQLAAAAALGSNIVMAGGLYASAYGACLDTAISLDTANASAEWVPQPSLPYVVYALGVVAISETRVLAIGGMCGASYHDEVFEVSISTPPLMCNARHHRPFFTA